MDAFSIRIAGLTVQVHPMFLSTKEYCKAYLTEEDPEIVVVTTPEDLRYEQEMADVEADEEGLKRRVFTDPFLERASIQRKIAEALLQRGVLLFHGSCVAVDGFAYLFTAACGTGKSTHTRFWRETFGDRAIMVNDDKPFLQVTSSGVYAHGSPWSGKHGLATNVCLPLKGICILRRGPENVIRPVKTEHVMDFLIHQGFASDTADGQELRNDLVTALVSQIPVWEMECTKDREAAQVAYNAMSR